MRDVLQNTARKFLIYMADSATPTAAKTGLSSFTVYLAKSGGAEATVSPTITERGHGWYEVTPTTGHRDTLGESAWTFTATGAIDFPHRETVVLYDSQLAAVGALTSLGANAPASWLNAAAIATDAITAAKIAAGALNGKGDWLTTLGSNAPVGWLNAAAVAAGALNGKGDWSVAGDEMGLTAGVLAALFSDTDTTALVNAIIARIETDLDGADLSVVAIATAVRNEVLDRVLSGNHETAGSVGKLLQFLDAAISGRATPADALAQATAALNAISSTALARFASVNTGEVTAAAGSVAKLAQGAGGGGGGIGDASQETLLEVQTTVEAIAAAQAGLPMQAAGRVASGGALVAFIGDDYRVRSGTQLEIPVSDPSGGLYTKLSAIGEANLRFSAAGPRTAAGAITGTIAALAQSGAGADLLCVISVEVVECGSGLRPGDEYVYQIESLRAQGEETDSFVELEGGLSLFRNVGA